VKIPRDLSGEELAGLLKKFGYNVTRQSGSHMRLTTTLQGEHHVTVPAKKSLRTGTLDTILGDVCDHFKIDKKSLMHQIFPDKK
jgi:predicted RNA binding protein YcfA (HicA-like mRNA interferase family)